VDVIGVLEVSGGSGGADEMQTVTARLGEACLSTFASCNAAEMQPELSASDEVCRADGNNTVEVVLGCSALTRDADRRGGLGGEVGEEEALRLPGNPSPELRPRTVMSR
jgi:hypothetical protein